MAPQGREQSTWDSMWDFLLKDSDLDNGKNCNISTPSTRAKQSKSTTTTSKAKKWSDDRSHIISRVGRSNIVMQPEDGFDNNLKSHEDTNVSIPASILVKEVKKSVVHHKKSNNVLKLLRTSSQLEESGIRSSTDLSKCASYSPEEATSPFYSLPTFGDLTMSHSSGSMLLNKYSVSELGISKSEEQVKSVIPSKLPSPSKRSSALKARAKCSPSMQPQAPKEQPLRQTTKIQEFTASNTLPANEPLAVPTQTANLSTFTDSLMNLGAANDNEDTSKVDAQNTRRSVPVTSGNVETKNKLFAFLKKPVLPPLYPKSKSALAWTSLKDNNSKIQQPEVIVSTESLETDLPKPHKLDKKKSRSFKKMLFRKKNKKDAIVSEARTTKNDNTLLQKTTSNDEPDIQSALQSAFLSPNMNLFPTTNNTANTPSKVHDTPKEEPQQEIKSSENIVPEITKFEKVDGLTILDSWLGGMDSDSTSEEGSTALSSNANTLSTDEGSVSTENLILPGTSNDSDSLYGSEGGFWTLFGKGYQRKSRREADSSRTSGHTWNDQGSWDTSTVDGESDYSEDSFISTEESMYSLDSLQAH